MTISRFICLQNGLSKTTGHWIVETEQWRKAAHANGVAWLGYGNAKLPADVARTCDVAPVFIARPYDSLGLDKNIKKLGSFIELSDLFFDTCRKHMPADISSNDLLFLPYTCDIEMYGLAKWLNSLAPDKRPAVACHFHQFDLTWTANLQDFTLSGDTSSWEYAARALMQVCGPQRLRLFGGGPQLSAVLQKLFKVPVHTMPLAIRFPDMQAGPQSQRRFDINIMGGARPEQGLALWGPIMAALAQIRPGVKVGVQLKDAKQEAEFRAQLQGFLPDADLDLHVGPLFDEAYSQRMCDSKLILLTYLPVRYSCRESGVFLEAAGCGVPCVVPEKTTMAAHIIRKEAAGLVFANGNTTHMARAVDAALDKVEILNQRAQSLSEPWRQKHSAVGHLARMLAEF